MPFFDFQALNNDGDLVSGVVEADSEDLALGLVEEEGLSPISIKKQSTSLLQTNLDFLQRVKAKDIVIMSRQLAVMVDASLPLVEALRLLVKQTKNPKLKGIISNVADEVEGGSRLSAALSSYPKQFSEFYISIIKSGETSGQLANVLNYLADQLEKDYDLQSKIRGAMIYPAFIFSGLMVVGVLMMIYVVPRMTEILKETGAELPVSTRILIFVSDWLVVYWWLALIILVGGFLGFRFSLRWREVRYWFDLLKLKLPIFGGLFKRIYVVRMTQSLSTLSAGKVPMADSLEIVKDIVGNAVYKDLIQQTIHEVRDGNSIASVLSKNKNVPDMLSQMLIVGEQTGRLDDILDRVTHFYTREVDNLVDNLVTLIEPIVMILMGVAVGIMVSAIILPIYTLSTAL
jgi:type II secretory pathway component PulF